MCVQMTWTRLAGALILLCTDCTALAYQRQPRLLQRQPRLRQPLLTATEEPLLASADTAKQTALPPVPPLLKGRSNSAAIWRVAWPSVAIGLLRAALGQVDAWYIGRLGSSELQAISAASFFIWVVYIAGELSSVSARLRSPSPSPASALDAGTVCMGPAAPAAAAAPAATAVPVAATSPCPSTAVPIVVRKPFPVAISP